jgi:eIF4-gamma/eIF5/eIF2-epsilon
VSRASREKSDRNSKGGSGSEGDGDGEANGDADAGSGDVDDADGEEEDDGGTEWKTDISADAVARRQREQLTLAAAALVQGAPDDGSEQAATEEPPPNGVHAADAKDAADDANTDDDGVDESALTPAELMRRRIAKRVAPLAFAEELFALPGIKGGAVGRMKVFYAAVFGDGAPGRLDERLRGVDKYVLALARDEKQQASQLIALEHFVTTVEPARLAEMPFLLKMLFEEGLIDEGVICQWGSVPEVQAVSKKAGVAPEAAAAVREASRAVLEWLAEASDDDEDDAEE